MAVYVDPSVKAQGWNGWRWATACHLFADSLPELHAFADRIGLNRSWFHASKGSVGHYDLNANMRAKAIEHGAVAVDRRAAVSIWRKNGGLI